MSLKIKLTEITNGQLFGLGYAFPDIGIVVKDGMIEIITNEDRQIENNILSYLYGCNIITKEACKGIWNI